MEGPTSSWRPVSGSILASSAEFVTLLRISRNSVPAIVFVATAWYFRALWEVTTIWLGTGSIAAEGAFSLKNEREVSIR